SFFPCHHFSSLLCFIKYQTPPTLFKTPPTLPLFPLFFPCSPPLKLKSELTNCSEELMERILSSNFSAPDRLGNDQISGESKVYTHKEMMMENKRSPCYLDQGNITSLSTKRHKADPSVPMKDRKEKFGERIVLLQQLVSPYGKTDTASVLLEAMEYIHFLHDQVKVCLSAQLVMFPSV
ncbi:Transcription factor bHLH153, partial [Linum grandiflorum]